MSALENSGHEVRPEHGAEPVNQAQLNPENYQAGRDERQIQGNEAFEDFPPSTVNGREQPLLTAAACVIGTIGNIAKHDRPITEPQLKIIARVADCYVDQLGALGLTIEQSAISPDAQNTINDYLTHQAATHPLPNARVAIKAVRDRYFPTVA